MTSNLRLKRVRYLVVAFLAAGTTAAVADVTVERESTAIIPAGMSLAATTPSPMPDRLFDASQSYPPSQAGVRKAAAEGPDALRRYIQRTRMIHNHYYWDFAKRE